MHTSPVRPACTLSCGYHVTWRGNDKLAAFLSRKAEALPFHTQQLTPRTKESQEARRSRLSSTPTASALVMRKIFTMLQTEPNPPLPPREKISQSRRHYFAFGSNLSLAQMAKRCPNSKFVGTAILPHYRWMINERGFANVVRSNSDWVEGLVFEIDIEDELRLDKSEGIAKQVFCDGTKGPCYEKYEMTLKVHCARGSLYRRPVPWIISKGGVGNVLSEADLEGSSGKRYRSETKTNVLVYISPHFVRDGNPRAEYVTRINSGVADARALGVTQDYIDMFIRKKIPPQGQAKPGSDAYPLKETVQPRTRAATDTYGSLGRERDLQRTAEQYATGRQGSTVQVEGQARQERAPYPNHGRPHTSPRSQSLNRPSTRYWIMDRTRTRRSFSLTRRHV
jgi:gamma-glutamylcyclotransferase